MHEIWNTNKSFTVFIGDGWFDIYVWHLYGFLFMLSSIFVLICQQLSILCQILIPFTKKYESSRKLQISLCVHALKNNDEKTNLGNGRVFPFA